MEKIQRKATKMIPELRNLSYKRRLQLPSRCHWMPENFSYSFTGETSSEMHGFTLASATLMSFSQQCLFLFFVFMSCILEKD
ncbi:hypothetical protein FHG87_006736 [Trinorchestia longiramus]|nr:hypothetical protein FHG87_006736 [Trinorchestia longiramus]